MYLLDTNVLSEIRKGNRADPNVRSWADRTSKERFFISVLSFGEIRKGMESVRRRDSKQARAIEAWLDQIQVQFEDDTLSISLEIADRWGRLMAEQTRSITDTLLAATALEWNLTLVTRNTKDFQIPNLNLLDPFTP